MALNNDMKMGGVITKIGVMHADGSVDWQKLHDRNMITKNGMKLFIDTRSLSRLRNGWAGGYEGYHYSWRYWCAFGSGKKKTDWNDNSLEDKKSEYYSTVYGSNATEFNGTTFNYNSQNKIMTCTYIGSNKSEAVREAVDVNEIGYFGQLTQDEGKLMFSRIVLSNTVHLNSGDSLITTYELRLQASCQTIEDEMGGYKFEAKICPYNFKNNDFQDVFPLGNAFNSLQNTNANDYELSYNAKASCLLFTPMANICNSTNYDWASSLSYMYKQMDSHNGSPRIYTTDKELPDGTNTWNDTPNYFDNITNQFATKTTEFIGNEVDGYTGGKFSAKFPVGWPNLSTTSNPIKIYRMNFRGMLFRFGYYDDKRLWHSVPIEKGYADTLKFTMAVTFTPNVDMEDA